MFSLFKHANSFKCLKQYGNTYGKSLSYCIRIGEHNFTSGTIENPIRVLTIIVKQVCIPCQLRACGFSSVCITIIVKSWSNTMADWYETSYKRSVCLKRSN